MTKTKKIHLEDQSDIYLLALAKHLKEPFFVSEQGVPFHSRKYTKEELKKILSDDDKDFVFDPDLYDEYEEVDGFYYEKLASTFLSIAVDRFEESSSVIMEEIHMEAGFALTEYCYFPIYSNENTGDCYLITDDVEDCVYAQLCQNLWIIPDEILKKYFVPYNKEVIHCLLSSLEYYRSNYGMFANPSSPLMGYGLIVNTFMKTILKRGDYLIAEAMKVLSPAQILSTFDRQTEFKTTFNGKTYYIYDLTLTTQLDQPNLEQEDM
jgi:hypothetical protein